MAIRLETQKDLGRVRTLPFCYMCGEPFVVSDDLTDDHVPPTGIFDKTDRQPPLILKAHWSCNNAESKNDHAIGQLIGLLQGRRPKQQHNKLDVRRHVIESGQQTAVLRGLDLPAIVRRWIRGFHAALYKEPLPHPGHFMTGVPLPAATEEGDSLKPEPIPPAFSKFVEELKRNRATGSLDRIVCRHGKCRYECVWTRADNSGPWICIYCLDLYDWIQLGDNRNFAPRGCVGTYIRPEGGVPRIASTSTHLLFDVPNRAVNDPFGE